MLTFEQHTGSGLVNSIINKLPVEIHVPTYQFCGPGTKLKQRLARGDKGINPLDAACKQHDIKYSENSSLSDRHKADFELENRAWERVKANDSSLGEKSAAWLITNTMKVKRKLGMGCAAGSFRKHILKPIKNHLKKSFKIDPGNNKSLRKASLAALHVARAALKKSGGRKKVRVPRIIPFESKTGGIIPLIPLFAGLSALGSLAGGASAIAKTVIDARNARQKLQENGQSKAMEEIGKKGAGLYLRKTPRGFGLYLKKQQSKNCQ